MCRNGSSLHWNLLENGMKNRLAALLVFGLFTNLALGMWHYDGVSALNFFSAGMCASILLQYLLEG